MASTCLDPAAAELVGLRLEDGALTLGEDALPGRDPTAGRYGAATWEPLVLSREPVAASVSLESEGGVETDLRTSADGERWSGWTPAAAGATLSLGAARFVQARATLSAGTEVPAPLLRAVCLALAPGPNDLVASEAPQDAPTVRLWGTREGMVGGRTANGHTIVERDHFVALPSRRALARLDGNEYQVKLKYGSRETTAPVWDVGPWNVQDNYWDPPADRDLFKDLPRFFPQALAAWRDGYNSGLDQFGRWVTYPAAIDIADGTFRDDLGMAAPDWVDVTFTWVTAPSPSPLPSYPKVLSGKPGATAAGQQASTNDPPPGQRWYFAEGSTRDPFQTWILIQNPSSDTAHVNLTSMLTDGSTRTQALDVPPTSRRSVYENQVLPDAEFSTRIDSDRPVFAERAMYVRKDGHATTGVQRPEKHWCSADGMTLDGADTWLLVQNPGAAPAHASFTFLLEGGGISRFATDLAPTSRLSLYTNLVVPNASFSVCLDADQPVIMERATYTAAGGANGGTAVSSAAPAWYFAEGNTLPGLSTRLAIGNPNQEASKVDITYLLESGDPVRRSVTVAPMGRLSVDPSVDVPGARFGIALAASKPVFADRTVAFGPSGMGTHSSAGVPALARTWYLPEGSTAAPFQEWILLANPGEVATNVTLDFMREDGSVVSRRYAMPARGRLSVDANAEVPDAAISVRATSDRPIVVERSMYWGGMSGGTNTTGLAWDR